MVNPIHDICSTHLGLDFLIPWWSNLQSYILANLFRPFKFLAPKDFILFGYQIFLTLSVHYGDYYTLLQKPSKK
jgi:hypothetical protein